MRWMWIDRIIEHEPGQRLVAVKNVTLAEDHLHDHFPATEDRPAEPVMPASLIIEGMAQTAGILVGAVNQFREKVILAKIAAAELECEVFPGQCIRYDASIERIDSAGATTRGTVSRRDADDPEWRAFGRINLMFSHIDRNFAGRAFPEHNFVFSDNFRMIVDAAGLEYSTSPNG